MHHRAIRSLLQSVAAAVVAACFVGTAPASIIWSGLTYTFVNAAGSDPTLPANQDRITDNVWLTRANIQGIYNIAQEAFYQGARRSGPSPMGTEWAFGTTANYSTLTYRSWALAANGSPPSLVGRSMVVHLIDDDIYLDIRFTAWGVGGIGGFSYIRAVPAPGAGVLLGLGALGFGCRRSRRAGSAVLAG